MESENKKALRTQCAVRAFRDALYTLLADQSNQEERLFACHANKKAVNEFVRSLLVQLSIGKHIFQPNNVLSCLTIRPACQGASSGLWQTSLAKM